MRFAACFALICLLGTTAAAQNRDERTVLDAAEKRVVREQYHEDHAITLRGSEAGGWQLSAGAAIDARNINLTLRNVRGEVRFRANSGRLEALLRRQRADVIQQLH